MYVLGSITYVMPSGLTKEGSNLPLASQSCIKKGSCVFVRLRLNLTNSRIFHRLFENSKEVHLQVLGNKSYFQRRKTLGSHLMLKKLVQDLKIPAHIIFLFKILIVYAERNSVDDEALRVE